MSPKSADGVLFTDAAYTSSTPPSVGFTARLGKLLFRSNPYGGTLALNGGLSSVVANVTPLSVEREIPTWLFEPFVNVNATYAPRPFGSVATTDPDALPVKRTIDGTHVMPWSSE